MPYRFFSDSGHGWLEVPMKELRRLGIYHAISEYSYRNGTVAYLEEDCDATTFVDAKKSEGGWSDSDCVEVVTLDGDSPVRGYDRF